LKNRAVTAIRVVAALAKNPLQGLDWARNGVEMVRGLADRDRRHEYLVSDEPGEALHGFLGAPWPCEHEPEFDSLWRDLVSELEALGSGFGTRYDADAALAQTNWCLVRHMRPRSIVETGVARGVNSRVLLEGLERNGVGHLYSIDLPPVLEEWRRQSGAAVPEWLRHRWTFLEGSSRRHLRKLLGRVEPIDIFLHDSLHSDANMRFEIGAAWPAVRSGGVLVADDVESNGAFGAFSATLPPASSFVARQDEIKSGLFGVAHKA
jgi:predicted O-methyltransferase YrrM